MDKFSHPLTARHVRRKVASVFAKVMTTLAYTSVGLSGVQSVYTRLAYGTSGVAGPRKCTQ